MAPFLDDDGLLERDWDTGAEGTVRFATVGLGWFGRDEAIPAIRDGDYGEVTVAVSGSAEKAARVADEYDLEAGITYGEYADGVATEHYDAVYIATPNATHLEQTEAAAAHGKHVLCEKPMEADTDRAAAMVAACADAGVELGVAYRMQAEPLTRRVRELVIDGFVGDVVGVDGAFTAPLLHRGDPDQWRFDPDLAGGGALYDIGIYPLNTSRFLLAADPATVDGSVVRNEGRLDGMDVHADLRLEFPDGTTASCRTSYDAARGSHVTVLGTEGRLRLEPAFGLGAERTLRAERDGVVTEVTAETDELIETFDRFAHGLLTGVGIGPDGDHGLVDMRAMAAVYESDRTGCRVEL